MKLHRYWFKFKLSINDAHPFGTLMGCGVTAWSKDDALNLLSERVFRIHPIAAVEKCIEDVDLRELDPNHVLPNSGDCTQRGVWFPLGY
jgi:hypothetical protein